MNRRKFLKAGLLWLPAFPAIVHAQSEDWFRVASEGKAAAGGGGCSTSVTIQNGATTGNGSIDDRNDGPPPTDTYASATFTAGITTTICQLTWRLGKAGSPTFHLKSGIWSDNGSNVPLAQIGTASSTVLASSLGTSEGDVVFTGISANITSGTVYHYVVWDSDASGFGGGANFVRVYFADNNGQSTHLYRSGDGTTWVLDSTNEQYKCTYFH